MDQDSGQTCCYGNFAEFLYGGVIFGGGHNARNLIYDITEEEAIAHLGKHKYCKNESFGMMH